MSEATPEAPRGRAAVRLAACALALALAVVVMSAYIRHAQAGFGCLDWPACYGSRVQAQRAAAAPAVRIARALHRAAASAVLVLSLVLLVTVWRVQDLRPARRFALLAIVAAVGLAALGALARGSAMPAVVVLNLLGGLALLAALTAAFASLTRGVMRPRLVRGSAAAVLAILFVQAFVGGLIGAQFAAPACASPANCRHWTWSEALDGGAWNPWRAPVMEEGAIVMPHGAAMLHAVHRATGVLLVLGVLFVAVVLHDGRRWTAWSLIVLAVVQSMLGIASSGPRPLLAYVLAHHVGAALLVVALAAIAVQPRRRSKRDPSPGH